MFGNSKKVHHYEEGAVDTLIGEQAKIEGVIYCQGSLRIEGNVKGEIHSQGEVFIGEKSQIEATIFARRVTVAGEVKGNIEAVNGLEILSTGKVNGDIVGDRLIIEEGAIYHGDVKMDVITPKKLSENHTLHNPVEHPKHIVTGDYPSTPPATEVKPTTQSAQ